MIRVAISDDALEDLHKGFWFYERQEIELGDYFTTCLRADIEGLKITGGIHRVVYLDYHSLLSRVFPYAVYYTCSGRGVTVWAVIDCRQDPDWIKEHLIRNSEQ